MTRVDYDKDGQPGQHSGSPATTPADANRNGFAGGSVQTLQCPIGATPAVTGVPAYTSTAGMCVRRVDYDPAGRPATEYFGTAVGAASANRKAVYSYTDDDLLAQTTTPDPQTDGGTARQTTSHTYDGSGRETRTTDQLGRITDFVYTSDGLASTRTAPPNGAVAHVTRAEYDANGAVKRSIDFANQTTTNTYTTHGLLRRTTNPLGFQTDYEYDAAANPIGVRSPEDVASGNAARKTVNYFTADNLLEATFVPVKADLTAWRRTLYAYDAAGRPTARAVQHRDERTRRAGRRYP